MRPMHEADENIRSVCLDPRDPQEQERAMTSKPFLERKPTTFKKVFPSVRSLLLTGKEYGDFREMSSIPIERRSTLHFSASNIPAKIACSNPRCQQGGYEMQLLLESLVSRRATRYEGTFHCPGHEGSPKGRRKGDSCCNYIEAAIQLDYKGDSES